MVTIFIKRTNVEQCGPVPKKVGFAHFKFIKIIQLFHDITTGNNELRYIKL